MKRIVLLIATLAAAVWSCSAQDVKIPLKFEKLAAKASESVEVNLDGQMLKLAGNFLSGKDKDEAKAKGIIANLKGIYVRSFEFEKAGEFTEDDIEGLRSQLQAPAWNRMVNTRSKRDGERVDIFFKIENDQITGMVILAVEPQEITFVNIVGPIDPEQLSELGGNFGIPKVDPGQRPNTKGKTK